MVPLRRRHQEGTKYASYLLGEMPVRENEEKAGGGFSSGENSSSSVTSVKERWKKQILSRGCRCHFGIPYLTCYHPWSHPTERPPTLHLSWTLPLPSSHGALRQLPPGLTATRRPPPPTSTLPQIQPNPSRRAHTDHRGYPLICWFWGTSEPPRTSFK